MCCCFFLVFFFVAYWVFNESSVLLFLYALLQQKFNDPSQDRLSVAIQKVEDVKHIMIQNIEKVLERGENITMLVSRVREHQYR